MKITVIGTGYVGLTSGVMFAHLGHKVTCLDIDIQKIAKLRIGEIPIFEPDLKQYMDDAVRNGFLSFTNNYAEALEGAQAIFIAVNTPEHENGTADLSYVYSVIDSIREIGTNALIIIKSTVPPGTTNKLEQYLRSFGLQTEVANNPEFLREGTSVHDFLYPDRIVFGVNSETAREILEEIHKPLIEKSYQKHGQEVKSQTKIFSTKPTTSEMIKYVSNAFLATKIAFINEVANICEKVGADIEELAYGVGLDSRIGRKFLKTGPGFGGSCFPKDISALLNLADIHEEEFLLLRAVVKANKRRPLEMIQKICAILGEDLASRKIAIWGLSFKANTDDVRNSPALEIIKLLLERSAEITAFCPAGIPGSLNSLPELEVALTAEEACIDAEAVVIVTEWPEFTEQNFDKIIGLMKSPIIIDFRNIFSCSDPRLKGFRYISLGREHG